MEQIEIKLGWKLHLFLFLCAACALGLECAAFFGLPRMWYYLTNLVLVPALLWGSFWIFVRIADRERHRSPGSKPRSG